MKSPAYLLLLFALVPRLMSTTTSTASTHVTVDQSSNIHLPSPDGKWEVDSVPPKTEKGNSTLVLKSLSEGLTHQLGDFFRSGTLMWCSNSRMLVFLDRHSAEDTRLRVFLVPGRDGVVNNSADSEIRRSALRSIGSGNRVLFYELDIPSCSGDEFAVSARVVTVGKAVKSGPAKQWEGKYTVHLKPLKVDRESFGVRAEGVETRAHAH
jgi:hypothetical protein